MNKNVILFGTRWFGVLGPCRILIDKLNQKGLKVYVLGNKDSFYEKYFDNNCELIEINISRKLFSPISDISTFFRLIILIHKLNPVFVHAFNPKPVILSSIILSFFPEIKLFSGITGMGNTFIKSKFQKFIAIIVLRIFLNKSEFIMFQNHDDIDFFTSHSLCQKAKARLFIGPGVDTDEFHCSNKIRHNENITVVCAARLLWQKGIREYIELAKWAKNEFNMIEFILAGHFDDEHPDRIPKKYIDEMHHLGVINFIGWVDDMVPFYTKADIAILFSYREGAPRGILEPMACCVPCIGADSIGIKDLIIHGETGYLVNTNDIEKVRKYLKKLIINEELRKTLGKNGRIKVVEQHSLIAASDAQFSMYEDANIFVNFQN
jgi:glycosyltransferase involved in cell wall biosynthesis